MLKIEKIAIATAAVIGATMLTPAPSQAGFDDFGVSVGGVTVCLTTSCTVKHKSGKKGKETNKPQARSRHRDNRPKHVDHRNPPKHVDHRTGPRHVDHRTTGTTTRVSDHPEDFELHYKDGVWYYTRKRAKSDRHPGNSAPSDWERCRQLQDQGYRIQCY